MFPIWAARLSASLLHRVSTEFLKLKAYSYILQFSGGMELFRITWSHSSESLPKHICNTHSRHSSFHAVELPRDHIETTMNILTACWHVQLHFGYDNGFNSTDSHCNHSDLYSKYDSHIFLFKCCIPKGQSMTRNRFTSDALNKGNLYWRTARMIFPLKIDSE